MTAQRTLGRPCVQLTGMKSAFSVPGSVPRRLGSRATCQLPEKPLRPWQAPLPFHGSRPWETCSFRCFVSACHDFAV